MARTVVWTHAAWEDLAEITDYIARDSTYYAAALARDLRDAARSLAIFAARGRIVPEVGDSRVRELFVHNYRIFTAMKGEWPS